MSAEVSKWTRTIAVSLTNQLAYKVNFLLMVVGPALVFYAVKVNLWTSIYRFDSLQAIQGFSLQRMLEYQAMVMVVGFISQGYNSRNLAEDIRLGRISAYLLYPFGFVRFHLASFLAFQIQGIAVAGITILLLFIGGFLPSLTLTSLLFGVFFSLLVSIFWFCVQFLIGAISFWLEETWVLRVMFLIVGGFLSGALFPLDLYPAWLRRALDFTPFPSLNYIPAQMFSGSYAGSYGEAFFVLCLWTGLFVATLLVVWRRGMRLYSAAGM